MYTHLCRSINQAGVKISTRHFCLEDAISEQKYRENCQHYSVVVMPVPVEELTDDYPTPTPTTATKEPKHRNTVTAKREAVTV